MTYELVFKKLILKLIFMILLFFFFIIIEFVHMYVAPLIYGVGNFMIVALISCTTLICNEVIEIAIYDDYKEIK